jgi:hypothetical protein
MAADSQEVAALPREVRDLAVRLGVTDSVPSSLVRLKQHGTSATSLRVGAMKFYAMQSIDVRRPEFEWHASIGPFGCISVLDALKGGEADLEVRVFGRFRIAGGNGGAVGAKGEIMRYLAELAWAPDAILYNHSLAWTVIDERTLRVSAGRQRGRGEVELRLDENGHIASVFAPDRPRREGHSFVERPWNGRFFDYRKHQRRWLPFAAEVGWTLEEQTFIAWRGEILDWRTD